jgi:hypothetical protein
MAERLRPLVPHVRLQVGVTGHRLGPKLPIESVTPIRATVDRILATVTSAANKMVEKRNGELIDRKLELVVVSALAEGADRIVADAGLAAGYLLEAVLPFARDEYVRDFESEASRKEFAALLERAASVFELDGTRPDANRAYEAAGLITLANCDLLVAIWDRNDAAGVGGTALVVNRAINEGIPVVLVDPAAPDHASLLLVADADLTPASLRHEDLPDRNAIEEIPDVVEFLVAPPAAGTKSRASLTSFLNEKERRWNLVPWYEFLRFAFAHRELRRSDFELPDYVESTRAQWADYFKILGREDRLAKAIDQILLPVFSMADNLSVYYARLFRGTFIFNYLASAVVALLAVTSLVLQIKSETGRIVWLLDLIGLGLIFFVIVNWLIAQRLDVHRRWLEYRRLAESLRHMRLIALTGSVGPIPRPGRAPDGDSDWVDWYGRAIRRILPLPDEKVDENYKIMIRRAASETELTSQINYHERNASEMKKLDHRLHLLGMCLFGTTLLLLALLLFMPAWPDLKPLKIVLTFLTIAFPIFGSAFNAIRAQADFLSISRRSRQTANRLIAVRSELSTGSPSFALLADRVEMASDMMMDDLVEWQLVFRTRPLSLPV